MRKTIYLIGFIALLLTSCEGDQGPPGSEGPEGPQGPEGGLLFAQVLEFGVDFTAENNYASLFSFPEDVEVFESDIVLAYHFAGVDDGADIWEAMPHIIYFNDGILSYSFDHTYLDINFYMDGTVDFSSLDPEFTDGHVFRVAIIPSEFAEAINTTDLNKVMNTFNIHEIRHLN